MSTKLPLVIAEILRYRESPRKFTRAFKELKHNADLCPLVERQINRILECFLKFNEIAYDIQGITDRGTDVVLRNYIQSDSGDSKARFTAFQIKSYHDLKSKDYLAKLKAQCFEATVEYGESLDQYYILLCTDKSEHEEKIRQVKKAFDSASNVTVIDPVYMATFLRLNPIRISSVVTTLMKEDDVVYEKAMSDIEAFTPTEAAVYCAIVLEATVSSGSRFSVEVIQNVPFIKEIYSSVPDYPREYFDYLDEVDFDTLNADDGTNLGRSEIEKGDDRRRDFSERFAEDVDALDGGLFSFDAARGIVDVDLDYGRAMQAVLLDGMVRYDCRKSALLNFAFSTLGILERFGFDELDEEKWPEEMTSLKRAI